MHEDLYLHFASTIQIGSSTIAVGIYFSEGGLMVIALAE